MVETGSKRSDVAFDRKLSDDESFKADQFMMTIGYRATQLFMQLALSTNNKFALRVLNEVIDENRMHVGESLKLLNDLAEEKEKVFANKTGKQEPK
jgi:hypothetical protein